MCGIAGIINLDDREIDARVLHTMDSCLRHRGPDGHGEYVDKNIGLANRRLAIIDPTPQGNQPMSSKDKNVWITFNGEIFNYPELRNDLIEKGFKFRTSTDTEVIIYGYKNYGLEFIKKLIGQFAFCIWDKIKGEFILVRDQLGINPLFYAYVGKSFIFASEVKAILATGLIKKEIEPEALHHYLSMFTIPAPPTIIKGVKSLLPGHILKVGKNGITQLKFWEIPIIPLEKKNNNMAAVKEELRNLLISSVSYASVSDVPVAAFLSGGIDSSIVVALMASMTKKPIQTFSLWSTGGENFDERKYARIIANKYKTDHTEFTISERDIISELPKIVYYFDQPTGGSLETYFISKAAGKKVKVALSGLGGDELFAGYHGSLYLTSKLADIYQNIPQFLRSWSIGVLNKMPLNLDQKKTLKIADKYLSADSILKRRLLYYFAFNEKEKRLLYTPSYIQIMEKFDTDKYFGSIYQKVKDLPIIDQLAYIDLHTYTRDDLLLGINMTSMANSLEVRVPFLDPRLVNFAMSINSRLKFHKGVTKYILKQIAQEWLPQEVINHRKTGFGLPRVKYMYGGLKKVILDVLSAESVKKRGIFNQDYVKLVVDSFYQNKSNKLLWNEHLRVWSLFIFELWCRIYLDNNKIDKPSISLVDLAS